MISRPSRPDTWVRGGSNLAEPCTTNMKRFECRAILFDLDGVLVDSTAYVEEQWRRWARSKGLPEEPFLRVCHGRRALETIRLAAPHLDAEAEVAAFVPEEEEGDGRFQAFEGAAQLLEALPRGTWAVATSGTRSMAIERLRGSALAIPSVLVCAEDVAHGKPSPDVYLRAAAELAIAPADCLVVEDAPAGIEAAHAAGMKVVAVTTTHPRHQLPADACTTSLANIHLGRLQSPLGGTSSLELLIQDR